ncbi:hypothetical protein [Sphingobium cloacae]|uniref:Secreted protein n=1 Tax=Sphingobium cloacae TaxID=120107 RepID=A0A1E1F558_9SPHN|nr:hypothetical protein [Sphingobium cloacae]BAV65612.1 hypothetical protein SCLO_1025720 [Sphingobium cloacae]
MPAFRIVALGSALIAAFPAASATASGPATRLVECRSGSCLLVSGQREDASSPVHINGHAVAVEGARKWRARVPVETVEDWSAPYARTITVAVEGHAEEARLPVGLLGHAENITMLVVRVK